MKRSNPAFSLQSLMKLKKKYEAVETAYNFKESLIETAIDEELKSLPKDQDIDENIHPFISGLKKDLNFYAILHEMIKMEDALLARFFKRILSLNHDKSLSQLHFIQLGLLREEFLLKAKEWLDYELTEGIAKDGVKIGGV